MDRASHLREDLDRWVAAGLITEDQAVAIFASEKTPATSYSRAALESSAGASRKVPVIAEALGYIGGSLLLVGFVVLTAHFWPDMATSSRLGLALGSALLTGGGGALVPGQSDAALARFQSFIWLVSTASTTLFAGVLVTDVLEASEYMVATYCGAAAAVHSGLLWKWRDNPLQLVVCLAGFVLVVNPVASSLGGDGVGGLATWILGWVYLAARLTGRAPQPKQTEKVGAIAVLLGLSQTAGTWPGPGSLLGIPTGFALIYLTTAQVGDDHDSFHPSLAVTGLLSLLLTVPATLGYYARDAAVTTGIATWVFGSGLLAIGARRLYQQPHLAVALGAVTMLGGAGVISAQAPGFATLFGVATAIGLVALGMMPGQVLLSIFGSIGLLIYVPFAAGHFFPGEGRAPLLIMVTGALIIVVAVLMIRMSGRIREDLRRTDD